jgi:hypothetical protein
MELAAFLELAKGFGSPVAVLVLAYLLWRIDRRLFKIEMHLWPSGAARTEGD